LLNLYRVAGPGSDIRTCSKRTYTFSIRLAAQYWPISCIKL